MFIQCICVGKVKENYLVQGMAEYSQRLKSYIRFQITEVADESTALKMSHLELEQVKAREGERILHCIKPASYVIALDSNGLLWSSEHLATHLNELVTYGTNHIVFIIGGSNGLSAHIFQRAQLKLSFGRMTLPHQLIRLVLIEQIYRVVKIHRGEPYHK